MATEILVAFNESPQARAALHHVLSTYPDADITALHVIDPLEWTTAGGMGGMGTGQFASEEVMEQAQESAENLMDEAEALSQDYGETITTVTEMGRPASTIVDYAEENNFDHIALGSHGRSGLARFLLGSVAESVAENSHRSVTIIRENDMNHE